MIIAGKKSKKGGSKSSQEAQEVEELFEEELGSDSDSSGSESEASQKTYKPKQVTRGKELENQIAQRRLYEEARGKVKKKRPKQPSNKRKNPPVTDEELAPVLDSRATSYITQSKTSTATRLASDSDSIASDSDLSDKENMAPARSKKTQADKAEEKAQKVAAENVALRQELALAKENTATLPENKDETNNVIAWTKRVMFCKYQFAFKPEDVERVTKKIYFKMHDKTRQLELGKHWMQRWIRTYSPVVKKGFSDSRGYRSQELRKVCHKYAREHEDLPTTQMIFKCLTGDIDLENKAEFDIYLWVWDKCWPAVAMAANWGPHSRHHHVMHTAVCPHDNTVSNVRLALISFYLPRILFPLALILTYSGFASVLSPPFSRPS